MKRLSLNRMFNRAAGELLSNRIVKELDNPYLVTQIKSILMITIVAIVIMTVYAYLYIMNGQWPIAAYQVIAAITMVVNIRIFKRTRDIQMTTHVIMAAMLPLFLILVYTGGLAGAGVIWIFLFPPGAFYLNGLKWGLVWVGILFTSMLSLIGAQAAGYIHMAYKSSYLLQIVLVLAVMAFIIYLHQKISDSARQLALEHTAKQELLNQQLALSSDRLERAKVQYEALLQSIGDGIIATDQDGRILLVNQAALGLLKLRIKDLIGQTIRVFRAEDESGKPIPYEERILTKVLRTNQRMHTTASSHYYYVDSLGRRFPVASTLAPVIIDGKNQGAVMVFRDVTEEKKVDDAKTELVSLASHQLNGPLTAVSWYTEMLMSGEAGKLTEEQHDYLEEIYSGNTKMVELVNDFLNASRVELGTFVPKYQPIDVVEVASAALTELTPEVNRKKLDVVRKFDKLPLLMLDRRTLQIILQNLLTNAVKYTDSGSITVELSTSGSGRKQQVHIGVADTGLGIPAAEQNKIFSKMYRAENARIHEAEGTGLGLYILKSIVDQLHGRIDFESREGHGTSFRVTLPVAGESGSPAAASLHTRAGKS